MSALEKETKLLLTPEGYESIREAGRVLECRDQLNVYLHDLHRLREHLGYFRVRYQGGREPVATLKIPAGWKGDTREMVEVERPLSELGPSLNPWPRRWVRVDTELPEGFREHFQDLGITRLRRLGWMRNHRCVVVLPPLGTVELDRTVLPDGSVLREVEIEDPADQVHGALVEGIRELAPEAEVSRVGKFSRFLRAAGYLE